MIRGAIILSILYYILADNISSFSIYLKRMENTLNNIIGLCNPSLVLMVNDSSDNDESIEEDKTLE
jgi:hypothetical protein